MTITTQYAALHVGPVDPLAPRFVEHPRITRFEWACQQCGASGLGFMSEEHASGACETTRRTYRMIPEVARDAQHTVVAILHGATHFMDGGGI